MALAGVRQGMSFWMWASIAPSCRSTPHNLVTVEPYQQGARVVLSTTDGYGRPPSPQVDRREVRPHICTRRAGARVRTGGTSLGDAGVELGGQGPLALAPRRAVSPSPSCPLLFQPQHLMVASSCGKKQVRVTDQFWDGILGESFKYCKYGFQVR